MPTITRRQVQQLRSLLRRAFGNVRGPGPALCFAASAGMLSVRAKLADVAVEYRVSSHATTENLHLPYQLLADCEGKRDEPVELLAAENGRVTAQWRDGNVPRIVCYEEQPAVLDFPDRPQELVENPPELLQALAAASETCDPESARYALSHFQLGADGTLTATDGRQLLVQAGFAFPWDSAVLLPRSRVFAALGAWIPKHPVPHATPQPEVGQSMDRFTANAAFHGQESTNNSHGHATQNGPTATQDAPARVGRVAIGRSDDWVVIDVGPWTIFLRINKEGRFPDVTKAVPQADSFSADCRFSPQDADFLGQALSRLPSDDTSHTPVTLDLNGHVAVRAKTADHPRPTEVRLNGSSWSGEPIRLNMNRAYLARALKLGFRELQVHGPTLPIVCRDRNRQFVWTTLTAEPIPPADDAIRIESCGSRVEATVANPEPRTRRPVVKISTPDPADTLPNALPAPVDALAGNSRQLPSRRVGARGAAFQEAVAAHHTMGPHSAVAHCASEKQCREADHREAGLETTGITRHRFAEHQPTPHNLAGLIQQAETLRNSLRELFANTNGLLRGLKQHRRQNRALESTIASLRTLKTLGV